MMQPYQGYAKIYDLTGQHRFGSRLARVALERLAEFGLHPKTAIDLATGTGAAALAMAATGLNVLAFDRSREMLNVAQTKPAPEVGSVEWRVGSMESFTAEQPVELVTCFFDSLNYLLDEQALSACFTSAAATLTSGGWFVFDVNTLGRFEADWSRTTQIAYEDDDLLCLFRSTYDPGTRISPLMLTVFERDRTNQERWRRWDEEHIERGYPLAELCVLLAQAGFGVEAIEAFNESTMEISGRANDASERAIFFARLGLTEDKIEP